MTPAPISVERFKLTLVGDINGLLGPFPAVKASPQGEYVRHSDYAALLHQLAERDAEVERLRRECDLRKRAVDRWVPCPDHRDKVDGRCQVCAKEAAEHAREEAFRLLKAFKVRPFKDMGRDELTIQCPSGYIVTVSDRGRLENRVLHEIAAAFLAASKQE